MKKYAAILHAPWVRGNDPDKIDGFWAEDASLYTVTVPEQLRNMLVDLQNNLSTKFRELEQKEQELNELRARLRLFFQS
jgi:hypothetical protein